MLRVDPEAHVQPPLPRCRCTSVRIQRVQLTHSQGVPSRFLYFPDENHWVLKPTNSKKWHVGRGIQSGLRDSPAARGVQVDRRVDSRAQGGFCQCWCIGGSGGARFPGVGTIVCDTGSKSLQRSKSSGRREGVIQAHTCMHLRTVAAAPAAPVLPDRPVACLAWCSNQVCLGKAWSIFNRQRGRHRRRGTLASGPFDNHHHCSSHFRRRHAQPAAHCTPELVVRIPHWPPSH